MKQDLTNINYEWLIKPTGDPFADVGGLVIEFLTKQEQYANLNILELIEEIAKIYVNKWGGKLHAFFLNSTITQPAFQGQKKIDETLKYYTGLLKETINYQEGTCRISGRNAKIFYAGRDNHLLSGSSGFINFHHGYENGLYLSKEMLIRFFFVPLGVIQLSDKIAVIQSNQEKVTGFFVRNNLQENFKSIGSNMSDGTLKSEFKNPANALFSFADKCIANLSIATNNEESNSKRENVVLNLYHFTNFGASPDIELHTLQAIVFFFHAYCLKNHRKEWVNFINHYYKNSKFKDATFNEVKKTWENSKEMADYETYKVWKNPIYENLLNGKSLLPLILKWSRTRKLSFKIVEIYQINIQNMEQKTLKKIKELADFIVRNPDAGAIKKSITRLNGIKSSAEIRHYFLKLIAENYGMGNAKPLITIEEFVEYLFPDGAGWREVRDLLLIAIYQKLHEIPDIKVELPEIEDENEFETQNEE